MKKLIHFVILAFVSINVKAQAVMQPIVLGRVDTINSVILKEKRPIWIYTPQFDTAYFSKPSYPVLYVLDGDTHFLQLVTMIKQLSAMNGNTVLPEMIIVGIPNTPGNRPRDLTPTHNSLMDKSSGGGDNFTLFLEKELMPYIDKNYATAPYRTLMGHSLGGLTAMNILLKHTNLFNAYVASDPSMFYDNRDLLKQVKGLLKRGNFKGRSLYLSIANTMPIGMDTLRVRHDTSMYTQHIRAILDLKDELTTNNTDNLKWTYKYYGDDDHSSLPLIAQYDALRFVFRNNHFPLNQPESQYFDRKLSASTLRQMIIDHYKLMSEERGYTVKPPEAHLNQFGYVFLQQKDLEKSAMFFNLNIQYYPNSFNVYDSIGDYYLAKNDKASAIKTLRKALSIKYTTEIADKLKKLE